MREPVDANFKSYYERILKGDLRAIGDYRERNGRRELDASFHEMIGRLVPLRSYRAVRQILSGIERHGATVLPTDRESFAYWYKKLKPLCDSARRFIRAERNSQSGKTRDKLWRGYALQGLPKVRYLHLAERQDEERAQEETNLYAQRVHRADREALLGWSDSHTKGSVRTRLEGLGFHEAELDKQIERTFHFERVERFAPRGLVTREIFFDLAQTTPPLGPAFVARRYACKIGGISESAVSHRSLRNKIE